MWATVFMFGAVGLVSSAARPNATANDTAPTEDGPLQKLHALWEDETEQLGNLSGRLLGDGRRMVDVFMVSAQRFLSGESGRPPNLLRLLQNDPCVRDGQPTPLLLLAFLLGFLAFPLGACCCARLRRRRFRARNRRLARGDAKARQANITDLAHLMDRDQDSDLDVL